MVDPSRPAPLSVASASRRISACDASSAIFRYARTTAIGAAIASTMLTPSAASSPAAAARRSSSTAPSATAGSASSTLPLSDSATRPPGTNAAS